MEQKKSNSEFCNLLKTKIIKQTEPSKGLMLIENEYVIKQSSVRSDLFINKNNQHK